jgi:predicted nucleotidyltransferase
MLPKPFKEFIELLEENGVNYLVVGGYAVSFHGNPRYTGNLDIFIAISEKDAQQTVKTFRDFGFSDLEITPSDFVESDMIIEVGREPLKIQVMTGISGVTFSECFNDRTIAQIDGIPIPFISFEKLLQNKTASGRPKDLADVHDLQQKRL